MDSIEITQIISLAIAPNPLGKGCIRKNLSNANTTSPWKKGINNGVSMIMFAIHTWVNGENMIKMV